MHKIKKHLWLATVILPAICFGQDQNINKQAVQSAGTMAPVVYANVQTAPVVAYESGATRLRDMLKLQASQEPAWTSYADAIDVYSKTYYEEKPIAAFATDPGPRQVGRLVDILQNRLAALDDIESAAKNLYATLDADQKKAADQFMVASVPVFASVGGAMCPDPSEKKAKSDKPPGAQRGRHSGGASSGTLGGGMPPSGAWNN